MKRLLAFLFTSRWRGAAALVEAQKLRDLCAAVYQVCGALDAPADVLDALSDASAGSYTEDPLSLLPCPLPEESMADLRDAQQGAEAPETHKLSGDATIPLDEVEAWLLKNEKAHASVMRGLEQAQGGEFADPPDLNDSADRRHFALDTPHWEAFVAALDAPPRQHPKMQRLLQEW